jgi:hypothetical protein
LYRILFIGLFFASGREIDATLADAVKHKCGAFAKSWGLRSVNAAASLNDIAKIDRNPLLTPH